MPALYFHCAPPCVYSFDKPVTCPLQSILLGSRLDTDIHSNTCRIAFQGRLLQGFDADDVKEKEKLKVFKMKEKQGAVDRVTKTTENIQHCAILLRILLMFVLFAFCLFDQVVDSQNLIGRDLFSKNTDMSNFVGLKVQLESGECGTIESSFGKGGKFKVYFPDGLPTTTPTTNDEEKKGKGKDKPMLKSK